MPLEPFQCLPLEFGSQVFLDLGGNAWLPAHPIPKGLSAEAHHI